MEFLSKDSSSIVEMNSNIIVEFPQLSFCQPLFSIGKSLLTSYKTLIVNSARSYSFRSIDAENETIITSSFEYIVEILFEIVIIFSDN